ncbi:MAG: hypothetical protein ACLFVO_16680 [Chloroflexaceae bacterium]
MSDWGQFNVVEHHPDVISGAWIFRGTRSPVAAMFENRATAQRLTSFPASPARRQKR